MSAPGHFDRAAPRLLALLAGASSGCAAIVGADFDVSARPQVAPDAGGIEGPRIVSSWKIDAPGVAQLVGLSVAVEGDTALIGARNADWAGQVFVAKRSPPDAWDIAQTLTAEQYAAPNALFGSSVALSGDWAVIGASAEQKTAPGTAYFFHRVDGTWTLTQEVKASPVPVDNDRFGTRVAIESDVAVIGAPGAGSDDAIGGAVHVFQLGSAGAWTESQRLTPPDGTADDSFGFELALRSTTLVVGAPFNDEAGTEAGAVYVFERSGPGWDPVPKKLGPRASDPAGYRMGLGTIGLEEGLLIVPSSSSVDAYEQDPSGTWVPDTLVPPRGLVAQPSGWRAAIHGTRAVLAVGTTDNIGMGLLYERAGSEWKFVERLESRSSTREDFFGWTIAYDGATACFGAIFAQDKDGAVYFFDLSK